MAELVVRRDEDGIAILSLNRPEVLNALSVDLFVELGLRFRVGQLPHAALVGENGVVVAAGLTNTREHVESLLEAKRRGVGSLQEYLELDSLRKA